MATLLAMTLKVVFAAALARRSVDDPDALDTSIAVDRSPATGTKAATAD